MMMGMDSDDREYCEVCDEREPLDDFSTETLRICESCWMTQPCPDCGRDREDHSETDDCSFGREI
jgi:hypothetical protein